MKKIIKFALLISCFFIFCLYTVNAYAQQKTVSMKKSMKVLVDDQKFWFSEQQLIARAIFAKKTNQVFLRLYINGMEYTEEAPVKNYCFSDTRFVFRIDPELKPVKTVAIVSNPDEFQNPDPPEKLNWINAKFLF